MDKLKEFMRRFIALMVMITMPIWGIPYLFYLLSYALFKMIYYMLWKRN
jgi:hypothetical protein